VKSTDFADDEISIVFARLDIIPSKSLVRSENSCESVLPLRKKPKDMQSIRSLGFSEHDSSTLFTGISPSASAR
jgi:hypothetical protein